MKTVVSAAVFGVIFGGVVFVFIGTVVGANSFDKEGCLAEESPESCHARSALGEWGPYVEPPVVNPLWIAVPIGVMTAVIGTVLWVANNELRKNQNEGGAP